MSSNLIDYQENADGIGTQKCLITSSGNFLFPLLNISIALNAKWGPHRGKSAIFSKFQTSSAAKPTNLKYRVPQAKDVR